MENGFRVPDFDKVPVDHMAEGMKLYIVHGVCTGSFLTALLSNDLIKAVKHADDDNMRVMREWVQFLEAHCPTPAYGSMENFFGWQKIGGLMGWNSGRRPDGWQTNE